jgi:hypothetical protein
MAEMVVGTGHVGVRDGILMKCCQMCTGGDPNVAAIVARHARGIRTAEQRGTRLYIFYGNVLYLQSKPYTA